MNHYRISEGEALSDIGKVVYINNGRESESGSFELGDDVKLKILLPRSLGAYSVDASIYNETANKTINFKPKWNDIDGIYDEYIAEISTGRIGVGLSFLTFKLHTICGIAYAGFRNGDIYFTKNKAYVYPIQISVSEFKYKNPEKYLGGIIYHIFVDRFNKSGVFPIKNGAEIVEFWNAEIPEYPKYPGADIKNRYFYGGNLRGIRDKLDYLASLGVSVIYLSPIFDATSNHKYDTSDYMTVDRMFGGEEELKSLIKSAKEKGIDIILDGVFNHTGDDSIYFNKYCNYNSVGAYQSKDSKYYSWYEFQDYPDKYTSWWGIDILPRINPDKPECGNYIAGKDGVVDKYSKLGIAGFRLDVVDELSDSFISSIKNRLNSNNSESILYGEVWEDASNKISYDKRKKYYCGNELDGVMNYPIKEGIISYLRYNDTGKLRYALSDIIFNAPTRIRNLQMNLLGSHDTMRILTALGGESPEGKTNEYLLKARMNDLELDNAVKKLKCAYTVLATLPGIPSIYYGDEAGMEGYSDPFNRRTYPWGNENKTILSHYRKIGKIRRENSVYKSGDYKLLLLTDDLLVFSRDDEKYSFLTILNNSKKDKYAVFSNEAKELLSGKTKSIFKLCKNSAKIFKVLKNTTLEI